MIAIELGRKIAETETKFTSYIQERGARLIEGGFSRPSHLGEPDELYVADDGIDRCFVLFGPPFWQMLERFQSQFYGTELGYSEFMLVEYAAIHDEPNWIHAVSATHLQLRLTKFKATRPLGRAAGEKPAACTIAGEVVEISDLNIIEKQLHAMVSPDLLQEHQPLSLMQENPQRLFPSPIIRTKDSLEMIYRVAAGSGRLLGRYSKRDNTVIKFSHTSAAFITSGGTPVERPKFT